MNTKAVEHNYHQSIKRLEGKECTLSKIYSFLNAKSGLLITSINDVNLPRGEGRIVIEHYAHKLQRVGELVLDNKPLEKGDLTFLLDQLHSVKRMLLAKNKSTAGLDLYLASLNDVISKTDYIAKGEDKTR